MKVEQTVLVEILDHFNLSYPVVLCEGLYEARGVNGVYKGIWSAESLDDLMFKVVYGERNWPSHVVVVNPTIGIKDATESLFHELTHAHQVERYIPAAAKDLLPLSANQTAALAIKHFIQDYERYGLTAVHSDEQSAVTLWGDQYVNHPMEVEAREVSERLSKQLTKPVFL